AREIGGEPLTRPGGGVALGERRRQAIGDHEFTDGGPTHRTGGVEVQLDLRNAAKALRPAHRRAPARPAPRRPGSVRRRVPRNDRRAGAVGLRRKPPSRPSRARRRRDWPPDRATAADAHPPCAPRCYRVPSPAAGGAAPSLLGSPPPSIWWKRSIRLLQHGAWGRRPRRAPARRIRAIGAT